MNEGELIDKIDDIITIGEAILKAMTEMKVEQEIPLNRRQAAVYLGVCPHTIDNYRASGKIKPCVVSGITGFLARDLDKLK